jgi:uncharacterized protein
MRVSGGTLEFSASDLSRHAGCRHLTALDLGVARGLHAAPTYRDPALDLLAQRGLEHERRYVNGLRAQGRTVVDLSSREGAALTTTVEATLDALRAGVEVIVQPALRHER